MEAWTGYLKGRRESSRHRRVGKSTYDEEGLFKGGRAGSRRRRLDLSRLSNKVISKQILGKSLFKICNHMISQTYTTFVLHNYYSSLKCLGKEYFLLYNIELKCITYNTFICKPYVMNLKPLSTKDPKNVP